MLRQAGTERPYTGEYWDTHTAGVYKCRACGTELFTSKEKFDSHCGWPSFWAPLAEGTVRYIHDRTLGMERVEVRCANCDSHLGHVFEGEGYGTPTDQRFCINSVSLKLVSTDDDGAGGKPGLRLNDAEGPRPAPQQRPRRGPSAVQRVVRSAPRQALWPSQRGAARATKLAATPPLELARSAHPTCHSLSYAQANFALGFLFACYARFRH